jgi:CysZ protein
VGDQGQLRTVANRGAAATGGVVRQFVLGAGLLGRGFGLVVRTPRLLAMGLLPALIAGLLYAAALGVLIAFLPELSHTVTWFADGWARAWLDVLRILAGLALLGAGVLVGVLTFTAVTLLIGDPFYERISIRVEARYGGVPGAVEVPFWQSLRRSLVDSVRLIAVSIGFGLPLLVLGFVPVVGQTLAPVLGAALGGWLLAIELTGVPFQRRGRRLRDRRRVLRANRPLALGFGVAVFLAFLIPLGAILLMPAAVAGGALLSRKALGQPIDIVTVPVDLGGVL